MAYSPINYIYDRLLKKFQSTLRTEYAGSLPVYIGETYKKNKSSHIRLFVNSVTNEDSKQKMLFNKVELEFRVYLNARQHNETVFKHLRDITNRLEQVLYENRRDANNYIDGRVEEITFNDTQDEEEFVDNLLVSTINYSVKIPMTYSLYGFFMTSDDKIFTTSNGKNFVILN
jgi:hypothetical protein|tara:strand:- start:26274 stop:26792 length:519 start_codon:yes stop_codon:yes gene_type:complete